MSKTSTTPPLKFILLMAALMSVTALSIDAMLPALGQIGMDLKTSHPNQQQLILTFVFVGVALGQLVAGPLSDAYGRRPILFGCLGLYMLGAAICLLSNSIETMLLGRIIQGLGASGPIVSCISIIRDRYDGREMAKVMSLVMMIFIMAPVVAPALGQGIMLVTTWRIIFAFFLVYAVVIGLWFKASMGETLAPKNRVPFRVSTLISGTKAVVNNRQTLLYSLAMGTVFAGFIGYLSSTQQIFEEQYKIGKIFVVYFGLQALGFGLSSLLNSRLVERLGMRFLVTRALIAMITIGLLTAVLSSFYTIPFPVFFLFGLTSLFCVGLLFGNLNALAMQPMGAIAGTAAAIISFISNLVSIPLGTMIGQFYNGTLVPISLGFVILGGVSLLLVRLAEQAKS